MMTPPFIFYFVVKRKKEGTLGATKVLQLHYERHVFQEALCKYETIS
jgi:hypothetical protein